jgi:hypothetical protein
MQVRLIYRFAVAVLSWMMPLARDPDRGAGQQGVAGAPRWPYSPASILRIARAASQPASGDPSAFQNSHSPTSTPCS